VRPAGREGMPVGRVQVCHAAAMSSRGDRPLIGDRQIEDTTNSLQIRRSVSNV